MEIEAFKEQLKAAHLNKKEFASLVGLSYQAVNNWGCSKNIPHWVESWLELYVRNVRYEELKKALKETGLCGRIEGEAS